jgi:tetratricopeptide (TPR) repeat protein
VREKFSLSNEFTRVFQADYALAVAWAGNPREAERLAEPVVPEGATPNDLSASRPLYVMGVIKRINGDDDAALRFQQRALAALPGGASAAIDRMRALTEIGSILRARAQPEQALVFLRQALVLSQRAQTHAAPERADILVGLGRATLALRRTADALPALREAGQIFRAFDPKSRWASDAALAATVLPSRRSSSRQQIRRVNVAGR